MIEIATSQLSPGVNYTFQLTVRSAPRGCVYACAHVY
jgi:hypothetical protein